MPSHHLNTQVPNLQIPIAQEGAATANERPCYEGKALRHQYQATTTPWQGTELGNEAGARGNEVTATEQERRKDQDQDHDTIETIPERCGRSFEMIK